MEFFKPWSRTGEKKKFESDEDLVPKTFIPKTKNYFYNNARNRISPLKYSDVLYENNWITKPKYP